MTLALIALGCAVLSWWLTGQLARPRIARLFLDHPNERSLHSKPVPRNGGVALWLAALPALALVVALEGAPPEPLKLAAAVFMIAAVAFTDDFKGLASTPRFVVQSLAAALVCMAGLVPPALILPGIELAWPTPVALGFAWLYLMWFTNLYNFMDGMDGFAGGMAVIGFGSFALLGWMEGHALFCGLSLVLAAAAAGFLGHNFPPARVFMGDTGSSTLGFCAALLSLWAEVAGIFSLWIAVLVFSPFVVDATVTLSHRAWRRERIWLAHRGHYYQRAVQLGWGHRRTVLGEYALMAMSAGAAMIAVARPAPLLQWVIVLAMLALYFGLMHAVATIEMRLKRRCSGN